MYSLLSDITEAMVSMESHRRCNVDQFYLVTGKIGEFITLDILVTGKTGEFCLHIVDFFICFLWYSGEKDILKHLIIHQP